MANHSRNTSGKYKGSNDVGQFREYVDSDREESRIESLTQHYDQRESERNFYEYGSRGKSYKTAGSEDHHTLTIRVPYEITELEHLLHNLEASGKNRSIQYQLFEGYLGEVKQLEHKLLELEAAGSEESANYFELENHLRLYIDLVHKIRELQSSGNEGSPEYLKLENQLHELQAQGRNLGKSHRDKSYKSGGGTTTNYSSFPDNTTGAGTTRYSTLTDGTSRRTGNTGRSTEISRLSHEIREIENEIHLLADSGKRNSKEQKELERRLSDLQYAISQAEKRSYATSAEPDYRSNFTGTTRHSREYDDTTYMSRHTSDRHGHDSKSHSTKRTSGDDYDHRERKSILTKRTGGETNNNPEGHSRHSRDHSDHKSHHRRSSTNSDNRRSSSGSGHHKHHHHEHGHCHRPTPEPPPPSIPEEEEYCIPPSQVDNSCEPPPRIPTVVDNSCEPPPRKPLLVDRSVQGMPPKKCEIPPKPIMVDESVQKVQPPVCKRNVDETISAVPIPSCPACYIPPKKPLMVDESVQKVQPPVCKRTVDETTSAVPIPSCPACYIPPKKPLMVDESVQKVQPPVCKRTVDETTSAVPIPSCPACYIPPPPAAESMSCKMVSDKPVGQSSSFLSCFLPTRRSSVCEIEEPPPPPPPPSCPVKPEVIDTSTSALYFPKQCPPKPPPPPVCPKPPPVCCPKPKPVDPCERPVETVKSRHMMDAAAGKSYVAMDTGVGASLPTLTRIKSIYEEVEEDDDDYELFPDREEELGVPAPSECAVVDNSRYVVEKRTEETINPNLCPYCGTGVFVRKTSAAGYLAAVLCFPCGLYCCLTQTCCYIIECTYCHATTERSAEDMNKSYVSPHRGTRESLQDVRSIYELEVEESTEDEWGKKGTRKSSRERIDRERDERDKRDRERRDKEERERRERDRKERERKEKEKKERDMKNANRNFKEERRDRDMYERDRTVRSSEKSDSNRRSIRFSN